MKTILYIFAVLALALPAQAQKQIREATAAEVAAKRISTAYASPHSLSNYLYSVDAVGFTQSNGTIYARSPINGGTYVYTNVSLSAFFAANPSYFVTNTRVLLANITSFKQARIDGGYDLDSGISPPSIPTIQISTDGGGNWMNATATNVPVLVSLYATSTHRSGATNIAVTVYSNADVQNRTNNLTGQTTLVSQSSDLASVTTVQGATTIAGSVTANWSTYSAVSAVNLAGHDLTLNSSWTVTYTNTVLRLRSGGRDVLTLTPASDSGTAPFIDAITLTTTNVTLQITAPNLPTVEYTTNLDAAVWVTLPSQSATSSGGYWYVTSPKPNATNAFFRAYCTVNPAAASAYLSGVLKLSASTNAPAVTGTDAAIWNSNKVFYGVSSTKTNLLLDLR